MSKQTSGSIKGFVYVASHVLTFPVKERLLDVVWREGRQQHLE